VRTDFTPEQLTDPDIAASEKVLRNCTHCGFWAATCPTYVLLGDELESPRGRIYLIKEMLAGSGSVTADTVKHVDRPLLPVVHDDLPVRRQLHAPRRPRPALDRRELPPAVGRAHAAAVSRRRSVAASNVSALAALRDGRQAVFGFSIRPALSAFWAGTRLDPACLADRSPERLPGRGRGANAGRDVAGMRPTGAGTQNQ
jgi:glycolate oxidase iron-sulfur subunit